MVEVDPRDLLMVSPVESDISEDEPWHDDALNRMRVAERLTNLVKIQEAPLSVSVSGDWGTGKTFILKRWQQSLQNQGYKAIYFNAWEDDFCDDPLLAMIGQMSEHFTDDRFKRVADAAKPLIGLTRKHFVAALNSLLSGAASSVASSVSGQPVAIPVEIPSDGWQNEERNSLKDYRKQRASKDELKICLQNLSNSVVLETGHPLVFIIDELDRCRPPFAIELLERVKHIFGVRNIVFVFGINRDELCKSLRTMYGEIDADVYLRRFFDMEFILPEVDADRFCNHLFVKYELRKFFFATSRDFNTSGYDQMSRFPEFWGRFNMSLRNLDYCARLMCLVGRNLKQDYPVYPWLLAALIALKINNPTLYRSLIQRQCRASEVMNYFNSRMSLESDGLTRLDRTLALIEGYLYCSEASRTDSVAETSAIDQFQLLKKGEELTHPEYLSEGIKQANSRRLEMLDETIRSVTGQSSGDFIGYLADLMGIYGEFLRR